MVKPGFWDDSEQARATVARRHRVVGRPAQGRPHVVAEDGDLIAGDLRPGRVVADDRDDGQPVAHERVEFGETVGRGAVPVDDPDLTAGSRDGGITFMV